MKACIFRSLLVFISFMLICDVVLASVQGLPWEDSVDTLMNSLTGPVGKAITVIAICFTGGMLAFGAELSGFAKASLGIGLAGALIMGAAQVVDVLFTGQGALFY